MERRRLSEEVVLLLGLALFLLWSLPFVDWTTDDAFISYRYAENLARGEGLVFNSGERVEGFSNPLWTLTLSLGRRLAVSPRLASKVLSLVFFVGIVAVSDRLLEVQGASLPFRFCLAGLLACDMSIVLYGVAGLETLSYGFFILVFTKLSVDRWTAEKDRVGSILTVGWLIMVSRPEGILYPAWFCLQYGLEAVKGRSVPRAHRVRFAVFLASVVTVLAMRYWYFGELVPNTFYAKPSGSFGRAFPTGGIAYLDEAVRDLGFVWPALLLFYFLDIKPKGLKKYRATLGSSIVVLVAFGFYAGGDWMPNTRFLVPVFPLVYVLSVGVLWDLVRWSRKYRYRHAVMGAAVTVAAVSFVHQGLFRSKILHRRDELPYDLMDADRHARDLGLWLKTHFRPSCVLATKRIGVVPYYSGLETLDLYGLIDKEIARIIYRHGSFMAGEAAEEIAAYVMEKAPAVVILYSLDTGSFKPHGPQEIALYEAMRGSYRTLGDVPFSKTYSSRIFVHRSRVSEAELERLKRSFMEELPATAAGDEPRGMKGAVLASLRRGGGGPLRREHVAQHGSVEVEIVVDCEAPQ